MGMSLPTDRVISTNQAVSRRIPHQGEDVNNCQWIGRLKDSGATVPEDTLPAKYLKPKVPENRTEN